MNTAVSNLEQGRKMLIRQMKASTWVSPQKTQQHRKEKSQ